VNERARSGYGRPGDNEEPSVTNSFPRRHLALFAVLAWASPVRSQVAEPASGPGVAVEFAPSASALPQEEIRAAVARELATFAREADAPSGTLHVSIAGDQLVVSFSPAPAPIARTTALPAAPQDIAWVTALLAGNLIRNEAIELLAERPAPTPLAAAPAAAAPIEPAPSPSGADEPRARAQPAYRPHARLSIAARGLLGLEYVGLTGGDPELGYGLAARIELLVLPFLGVGLQLGTTHFGLSESQFAGDPGTADFSDFSVLLKLQHPLAELPLELALVLAPGFTLDGEVEIGEVELRARPGMVEDAAFPLDMGYSLAAWLGATWWWTEHFGTFLEAGVEWRQAHVREQSTSFSLSDTSRYRLDLQGGTPLQKLWATMGSLHVGATYRFD
jgi:hypothetical protein